MFLKYFLKDFQFLECFVCITTSENNLKLKNGIGLKYLDICCLNFNDLFDILKQHLYHLKDNFSASFFVFYVSLIHLEQFLWQVLRNYLLWSPGRIFCLEDDAGVILQVVDSTWQRILSSVMFSLKQRSQRSCHANKAVPGNL